MGWIRLSYDWIWPSMASNTTSGFECATASARPVGFVFSFETRRSSRLVATSASLCARTSCGRDV